MVIFSVADKQAEDNNHVCLVSRFAVRNNAYSALIECKFSLFVHEELRSRLT